jgi:DNA-binding MarR family transcriptional regulator
VATATQRAGRRASLEAFSSSFQRVTAALRRLQGRETHRPDEVSFAQYKLLFELSRCGATTTGELASAAALSPPSVSQMLDNLAALGLVERVRSETDRRVVVTRLTEEGVRKIEVRHAEVQPRWEAALAQFTPAELEVAGQVLDSLTVMFGEFAEHHPADDAPS